MLPMLLSAALAATPVLQGARAEAQRTYLVVLEAALAGGGYETAAKDLARAHRGEIVRWQGGWDELERVLVERKPAELALVLAPATIDANLPRRLVPLLTRFDDDPFVDCAFGIVTGADAKDAQRFVQRALEASRAKPLQRAFSATSVSVDSCARLGPVREARGPARVLERNDLWITGKDEEWRDFVRRNRGLGEQCALVEWGHCGDSQGIWLFSMFHNREREKHWPFDPDKVGQDPEGEMPRLTALDLLEGVDLFPAVVVNGACHSGVTSVTMVGGDIVSTFGDTGGVVRFHAIAPEQSFALMAIRHGAVAYVAPLAANNANRAALDMWRIEEGGVALGEVLKRSYDELVLGDDRRRLELELFRDGRPAPEEAPMFADTLHRVLFGDPAHVVWKEPVETPHRLKVQPEERGLRVELRWERLEEDPWVWDPWRNARGGPERGRLYERILLEQFPPGRPVVDVVSAQAWRGKQSTPLELEAVALVERDLDGRAVLHLKASGARDAMDRRGPPGGPDALEATFLVRFETPRTAK